jgi:hypothetical protein
MKLPIQAQAINRQVSATSFTTKGIAPSDCGCGNQTCYGVCLFGSCLGYCG